MPVPTCVYVPELGMFRVLHCVGKSFSSGGYGVSIPSVVSESDRTDDALKGEHHREKVPFASSSDSDTNPMKDLGRTSDEDGEKSSEQEPKPARTTAALNHLFIEEALFLQQQGLLRVLSEGQSSELCTRDLFQLLPGLQLSLPVYLSYAHLRAQDYRVLRHVPARLEVHSNNTADTKEQLRQQARRARAPQLVSTASSSRDATTPAWDVYLPNTHFRKTNPGAPDTCVIVTSYNGGTSGAVTFDTLCELLAYCRHGASHKIDGDKTTNVQIAAVADSGTVVMFGLTDLGVEDISAGSGQDA